MVNEMLTAVILAAAGVTGGERPIESALLRSAEFCGYHVSGGQRPEFPVEAYLDMPASFGGDGQIKTAAAVPPLIHRFAAMTRSARSGWTGDFVRLPSTEGAVWIVFSNTLPLCDVAVTGLEQPPEPPRALVEHLQTAGWLLVAEQDIDDSAPLWRFVLQRPAADAAGGNRIVQLSVHGIRIGSSPDGIQMEMNMIAGRQAGD